MTNNDADQLYNWPTVIQLIQMYVGVQMYGGNRYMVGAWMYGEHE